MKKWKRKKTELILGEKYFKVRKDLVELPNGKTKSWVYWDSPDSVLVLALTKNKKVIMNKQYRYLVGSEVMELSAGSAKKRESAEKAARREFEEESGYKCGSLVKLGSLYETYGQLNRQMHIFFAKVIGKAEQKLDDFENIEVTLVDFDEAVEMAAQNKIPDMGSALAILLLKEKIKLGKVKI